MIEISSLVFCFCWRRRTRTRSEMDHHSRGENISRKPPDLDRKSTSSWPGSHFSVDRATFFDQNHVSLTSITFFTIRITFLQIESGQRSCGEDYGLLISPPDLWNHLWFWESSQVVYIGRAGVCIVLFFNVFLKALMCLILYFYNSIKQFRTQMYITMGNLART